MFCYGKWLENILSQVVSSKKGITSILLRTWRCVLIIHIMYIEKVLSHKLIYWNWSLTKRYSWISHSKYVCYYFALQTFDKINISPIMEKKNGKKRKLISMVINANICIKLLSSHVSQLVNNTLLMWLNVGAYMCSWIYANNFTLLDI